MCVSNPFLLKSYFHVLLSPKDYWIMSIQSTYFRLFPLLLGSSRSRINFAASFVSKRGTSKSSDDSSNSSDFDQESLQHNPFFKKYAQKIYKLKQSNPEEYKKRMKLLQSMHSTPNDSKSETPDKPESKKSSNIPSTKSGQPAAKDLGTILNLDKVNQLSAEEIRSLWIEYYSKKDGVCAVIPSSTYRSLHAVASQFPVFIYPVPRKDGFEMFIGQFANDDFHFTSLVNYQKHQENAPSLFDMKHYTELEKEKGIVLMSGIVFDEGISITDAQFLSYLVQHFHMEHYDLMQHFNLSPTTFKYDDVIKAIDQTLLAKAGKK